MQQYVTSCNVEVKVEVEHVLEMEVYFISSNTSRNWVLVISLVFCSLLFSLESSSDLLCVKEV